ncbi:hypothetical protein [Dictyobacter kobayashii]|uniref:Uncharacterized protein n=1 Tax=Dictyobacter kobayashii TaxID=2014872 RepID=A0A402AMV3_9CHLR|nr:hypothetical protein [Dictyobacter kobayashii]GCE20364.1 hypothetical protein KDK_41640 [Dictyobacter kobayashii]
MARGRKEAIAVSVLREILLDRIAIERKLKRLIRDQLVEASLLSIVFSRLQFFEDDIRNALDELEHE